MQNNIIQHLAAVSYIKSYLLGLFWSLMRCRYKKRKEKEGLNELWPCVENNPF